MNNHEWVLRDRTWDCQFYDGTNGLALCDRFDNSNIKLHEGCLCRFHTDHVEPLVVGSWICYHPVAGMLVLSDAVFRQAFDCYERE